MYRIAGDEYKDLINVALTLPTVIGKILSERVSIVKLENNVLFIKVENNVWMQELVIRKKQIIDGIKKKCHVKLENIVFITQYMRGK